MQIQNFHPPVSLSLKSSSDSVESTVKDGVKGAAETQEQAKVKKACEDFEAVFLNMILSKMRDTVPQSDLMGNDQGQKLYRGMLDEEMSKQMAANGGMGLGEMLYHQLTMKK